MQDPNGGVRTLRLDERPVDGWHVNHLLQRVDELEEKNGLLRAKLNDARDRLARLESQNRHLRERLLRAVSDCD